MKIQNEDGYITCDATSGEFQETTNAFSANQQTGFLVVVLNRIMWSKNDRFDTRNQLLFNQVTQDETIEEGASEDNDELSGNKKGE